MKKRIKILVVLIVLAAIVLFAFLLISRKKHKLASAPKYGLAPISVRVADAKVGNLSTKIDYLAVVEPVETANVSSRLTATIDELFCDEGDTVKAGDTLIKLDGREIKSDIAQAQSELQANKATVTSLEKSVAYWNREAQRDKTLADKGDIAGAAAEATTDKASEFKGKLDAAKHKSAALEHLIDSLETKLSYCTIKSPYDGLVTQRLVDPGDLASPGKTLVVVENRSQLKLAFDVPQQDLSKVKEGLNVEFSVDGDGRQAALSHLFPSLNRARMLRAEVFLSDKQIAGLSCGQYIPVSVVLNVLKDVVLVPASSLIENPNHSQYVFIVKDGQLSHHKVKVLASTEDRVAVEGIDPNEQVVINTFLGWTTLSAGKMVEVLQ